MQAMAPRDGFLGSWDRFVGPGATTAENVGAVGLGLLGSAMALVTAHRRGWTTQQAALMATLAGDLLGGAWANNTAAAKRWYHRPGEGLRQQLIFAGFHIHPFLISKILGHEDRRYAPAHYGYLLAAVWLLQQLPTRLQQPTAISLTLGGIALDRALRPVEGCEWFAGVYYTKLLVGHASA